MIKSMTGYGKGEATCADKKITVEIRSLNGKQFDLSLKMPSIYRSAEQDVRNMVSKAMGRGKVDIYINYETAAGGSRSTTIDADVFVGYLRQMEEMAVAGGVEWGGGAAAAMMPAILRLPDVVCTAEAREVSDEESSALLKAVELALSHIDDFRIQEGQILHDEILGRVANIENLLVQVAPFESARIESVRKRIRDSIESLSVPIDSNRLEQELIFYVEKLDITEEKVRLANHCLYFRETAAQDQENGRKLGFITQEMGREINTLGSKANNADMQRVVVQMKDELEKIKEQSLNVL